MIVTDILQNLNICSIEIICRGIFLRWRLLLFVSYVILINSEYMFIFVFLKQVHIKWHTNMDLHSYWSISASLNMNGALQRDQNCFLLKCIYDTERFNMSKFFLSLATYPQNCLSTEIQPLWNIVPCAVNSQHCLISPLFFLPTPGCQNASV